MEAYTLNRFLYWKYYAMLLYYRLQDLPWTVRIAVVFASVSLILLAILLVRNILTTNRASRQARRISDCRDKYYEDMKAVALNSEVLDSSEIAQWLKLPAKFKMKPKLTKPLIPVLFELYQETRRTMNKVNWRRMLGVLKIPAYFELQMRSPRTGDRIMALKNVADISADLKEAVASRYLFSRDVKLKNSARLHAARFGTSYPFRVIEEDPKLLFTQELMVKFHNVLLYRHDNGLPMPNFVQWCTRLPLNEDFRVFAVNEILLFKVREDCPDLLQMLCDSHDERFSCAIIETLGELDYAPAEEELKRRYPSASFHERRTIAEALGKLGHGSASVVDFLVDGYHMATDYVTGMKLLRILFNCGEAGREAFYRLKAASEPKYVIMFEHIECPLIKSERYA